MHTTLAWLHARVTSGFAALFSASNVDSVGLGGGFDLAAAARDTPTWHAQSIAAFLRRAFRESQPRSPPEQLPIVLRVLLSQVHRLRALKLLARFLDFGPWAVNLALGVGIFPYALKLLQGSAKELRALLVFIWATTLLSVDPSCLVDLVKDHKYFLAVLQNNSVSKEYRTPSVFVLACIEDNFILGQTSTLKGWSRAA